MTQLAFFKQFVAHQTIGNVSMQCNSNRMDNTTVSHTQPIPKNIYEDPCKHKDPHRFFLLNEKEKIGKVLIHFALTEKDRTSLGARPKLTTSPRSLIGMGNSKETNQEILSLRGPELSVELSTEAHADIVLILKVTRLKI